LQQVGSRFASDETPGLLESHHAFVVPARSYIDNRVIDALITQGVLDNELVADVLAIDFTTPVYSRARASLIAYAPEQARDAGENLNRTTQHWDTHVALVPSGGLHHVQPVS
jgi:hypothetical protein